MIFVVLGIAILFVSFIIALFSLLREQKTLPSESLDVDSGEFDHSKETHQENIASLAKPGISTEAASSGVVEVSGKQYEPEAREPFPWEQSGESKESSRGDYGQFSIGEEPKLAGEISLKDIKENN